MRKEPSLELEFCMWYSGCAICHIPGIPMKNVKDNAWMENTRMN
jgi:hypothetical protein